MAHFHDIAVGGDLVATAEGGGRVCVWSTASRSLVGCFDSVYELGGTRLALCGEIVVAGAWARHGVCAYSLDGRQLWQRGDLKQPQHLAPADGGVAAGLEAGPMQLLDAATGETVTKLRGLREYWQGPGGMAAATRREEIALLKDGELRWRRPLGGFSALAVAFSPDTVLVSAAVGPLRCFELDGELRWEWAPPVGAHVLALGWHGREWVGLLYRYQDHAGDALVRCTPEGEVVMGPAVAEAAGYAFARDGEQLICGDGRVVDTSTGDVVWTMSPPG